MKRSSSPRSRVLSLDSAFADFKTSESIMRVSGLNLKGAFTRDRRPKIVARVLRESWAGSKIAVPDKRG